MTLGSRVSPIVERVISQRRRCGQELLEQAEAENAHAFAAKGHVGALRVDASLCLSRIYYYDRLNDSRC